MTSFFLRRGMQMLAVLGLSTIAVFGLLHLVPGGPLDDLLLNTDRRRRVTTADLRRMERALGLDKPLHVRYLTWVAGDDWLAALGLPELEGDARGVLRGDWGTSWFLSRNQPVLRVIGQRLPATLTLQLSSLLISLALAIPIGVISAVKQYSRLDYALTSLSFIGISLPAFWFAMLLIAAALALRHNGWPIVPTGDITAIRPYSVLLLGRIAPESLADRVLHLVLPVSVLVLTTLPVFSRFLRAAMLESLKQDYVRTARAKGLRERRVIFKHTLRNAAIPLVTVVIGTIPQLFSGSVIVEKIFNYKGVGYLFIQALNLRDWPLVSAILLINAILIVLATLIMDLLYVVIDPRIGLE